LSVSASKPDSSYSQMDEKTLTFLRRTFREHYFKHHDAVEIPTMMPNREFGYIPFGKGMVRHLSYKSPGELAADLVKQAPSSVYCSNGVYSNPTLPMDEKGWKGAELIFDIDAGSIPTACRTRHSFWICKTCGNVRRQIERPARCTKCEGTNSAQLHWSCGECLAATKEQAFRLIDFLTKDFGVSHAKIGTYFSGNRGYHVHVQDERFEAMEPSARAEIANYIKGTNLFVRPQSPGRGQTGRRGGGADRGGISGGGGGKGGWPERVAMSADKDQPQKPEQITGAFGSMIDEAVTTDIHRIFRMPGTLHGNSGLLKVRVNDLASFMPDDDPVVLSEEETKAFVASSPDFILKGRKFGPYTSKELELPIYAAVYLLIKGLGRAVD
jgi:DNA primase small subunit